MSEQRYTVSMEDDPMTGSIHIKINDFVYVSVNYDYRYTDNACRSRLADHIFEHLFGREALLKAKSITPESGGGE